MHDPATFEAEVPRGQPASTAGGSRSAHIFYFGTKYSEPMQAYVTLKGRQPGAGAHGQLRHRCVRGWSAASSRRATTRPASSGSDAAAPYAAGLINLKRRTAPAPRRARRSTSGSTRPGWRRSTTTGTSGRAPSSPTWTLIGLPWQVVVGPRGGAERRGRDQAPRHRRTRGGAGGDGGRPPAGRLRHAFLPATIIAIVHRRRPRCPRRRNRARDRTNMFNAFETHGGVPLPSAPGGGRASSRSSPGFSLLGIALGRRDADHRDGGDERFPGGARDPRARPQRASVGLWPLRQSDRLAAPRRADRRASRT